MTLPRDLGAKPTLAWLPLAELHVDHTYQHTVEGRASSKLIRHIAASFSWPLFGAVTAARGPQGYFLVDGQHRAEGARQAGVTEVPAIIIDAVDARAQARAFLGTNYRRISVNPYAIFHAEVVAGEEKAARTARVIAAAGVAVPRSPLQADRLKPNQTLAIGYIARAIKQFGEWETTHALKTLLAVARGTPGCLRSHLILATAEMMVGSDTQRTEVAATLKRIGINALEEAADRMQFLHGQSRVSTIFNILKTGKLPGVQELNSSAPNLSVAAPKQEKFNTPVTRRCEKCQQKFMTMLAVKTQCDKCKAAA